MLVADNALRDPAHRHGNTVVGGAFPLDDFVSAVPHGPVNPVHGLIMLVVAAELAEIIDADTGDIGAAPDGKLAVAVFTDNIGVNASAVHIEMLA